MRTPKLTLARFNFVAGLASSVLLSAGCANMQTTAGNDLPVGAEATLTGRVHGGNQPVSGATVYLYAVGQTGVGQGAVLYATTTTASNGTGSFSFVKAAGSVNTLTPATPTTPNYTCPAGTTSGGQAIADPLMYIYTKGGNTTNDGSSNTNSAAAFLAPVGYCSQINASSFVDISEVTTVATVASVAQFINPTTDQIGNDGIAVAYAAMGNAFKTIPNLVSAATGLSTPTSSLAGSGTGVSGVTMNVTAPAAQLNTMANIISACVNQSTSTSTTNCSTLFTNAKAPASAANLSQPSASYGMATDTVEAVLNMILNPTSSGSAARTSLFNLQPAAGAPYGPTLSGAPNNWLLSVTYNSAAACGALGASNFFAHPYDINADVNGNLWIANHAGGNGAVVEISPNGLPMTCVTLGGSSLGGGVVDTNGSIWYADNLGGKVYAYNPTTNVVRSFNAPGALAITADGIGNVFFTTLTGSTGSLYEILNATDPNNTSSPVLISSAAGPNPARIFPDSANDIWATSGSTFVTEFALQANQSGTNYAATQYNVVGPTYGIVVGKGNRVYITSQDSNSTVTVLGPPSSGTTFTTLYTTSSANTGGLNTPTSIWVDGAQNSWIGNNTAETSGTYSVSELSPTLVAVSPSGTNGGYQTTLNAPRTTIVDSIGNVWVLNDGAPNTITQILGAAVPVYAPYSTGIGNGRFQSIP